MAELEKNKKYCEAIESNEVKVYKALREDFQDAQLNLKSRM